MLRDTVIRGGGGSGSNLDWQGAWVDGSAYVVNDLVENNGSSYIAIQSHVATSATEPGVGGSWETVWDLMAQKGADGADGADGVDGTDGTDGISFIWRGLWSDSSSYIINDVVYNNGSSYISISSHDASFTTEPGDGTSWTVVWDLMALKGTDGVDGAFDRCDKLILEMEMEFKTSHLCYYKDLTYNAQNQLTDLDIYTDSTATIRLFHKDFTYNVQKLLVQTDLTRISDGALLISVFSYDGKKNLISIERSGYCECT